MNGIPEQIDESILDMFHDFIRHMSTSTANISEVTVNPFRLAARDKTYSLYYNDELAHQWKKVTDFSKADIDYLRYYQGDALRSVESKWNLVQDSSRKYEWRGPESAAKIEWVNKPNSNIFEVHAPGQSWEFTNLDLSHMKTRWLLQEFEPWDMEFHIRQKQVALEKFQNVDGINQFTAKLLVEEQSITTFEELEESTFDNIPLTNTEQFKDNIQTAIDEHGKIITDERLSQLRVHKLGSALTNNEKTE